MLCAKKYLKNIGFIRHRHRIWHRMIFNVLYTVSQVWVSKYVYRRVTGKSLNLIKPRDFNEKLQWLKLYWQHPLIVTCSDKYDVREYVESCGCREILNELYGVYEDSRDIDWASLPTQFALKATHGCGWNIICSDKSGLDRDETLLKLGAWMKTDYSRLMAEFHYAKIKPRLVCERYIGDGSGRVPNDYKVYCFNGLPKLVLVCSEREVDLKLIYMDLNWNEVNILCGKANRGDKPKQPKCFDDMLRCSRQLSKPFPFVRVDFYEYDDALIFGEMTFTESACVAWQYSEYGLDLLGGMIELPEKYRSN